MMVESKKHVPDNGAPGAFQAQVHLRCPQLAVLTSSDSSLLSAHSAGSAFWHGETDEESDDDDVQLVGVTAVSASQAGA